MKKETFTFGVGVAAGVILGLLIEDKNKKRIKEIILNQVNRIRTRRKYEDLSQKERKITKEELQRAKIRYRLYR